MHALSKQWKIGLQLLLLVGLLAAGGATRRHVLNAQRTLTATGNLSFSLESALAFRRIQMVYRDGHLPDIDRAIAYPEGVVSRATDTLGAEMALAHAAKAWPGILNLAEKIRWLELGWLLLAIPGMFFWVKWMGGGITGGFWAAAFYAVAISAVARSTGQELSHENHALPLLMWHLALQALCLRRLGAGASGGRLSLGLFLTGWAAAILAALALSTWDLIQFYLLLYMIWQLVLVAAGRFTEARMKVVVGPLLVCLAYVGLANPYLALHGFMHSPAMWLGYALILLRLGGRSRAWTAVRTVLLAALLAWAVWHFSGGYGRAYGHFGELLWAKLRFFNCRPDDPAMLTFNQRILWVPALNSTSWAMVWEWFPMLLGLTAAAVFGLILRNFRLPRENEAFPFLIFLLFGSLFAFILFFRFHVWLAVFACGLLGLWAGPVLVRGRKPLRIVVLALLICGWVVEAGQTWQDAVRWGRPNVYAAETEALMEYLRKFVAPEPVLANFGISAGIAAYGGCPVVLHPKFESPDIRKKVREYGEALFTGNEEEFRDWMQSNGATVYVHSMGEFSDIQPGLQMRYMVDALDPMEEAAARLFEQRPEELRFFVPEFGNRKYRVYRLKSSPVAARLSQTLSGRAREALETGELPLAEQWSAHALRMDPENAEAQETLRHASILRENGFRSEEELDWAEVEAPAIAPANPW
ncbi:MAG: hypothetical protein LBN38_03070 [Verrucomicrobiota bacterium]|jgi:hypothetical protein|nr:hypothetical protein [Verrucomicrobiota bacterium]